MKHRIAKYVINNVCELNLNVAYVINDILFCFLRNKW